MNKTIYQFWQGVIPPEVQREIDDLKAKAEKAGFKYEMYDLDRLLDDLKNDTLHWDHVNRASNLKESLLRMWKYLPISMAGSATSDFFRFWCLQNGGLYCDTDVICTTDEFPDFSEFKNGVWTTSEQTAIHNLNTCITWCDGDKGKEYSRILTYLAATRLNQTWLGSFNDCKLNAEYLKHNKWSLIGYIGPGFVRNQLLALYEEGIEVKRFDYKFSSSHDSKSILWHAGDGTWVNGGKGNDNAQRKTGKAI